MLTDSTGAFQEIRLLGAGRDEESYIEAFHDNLRRIFEGLRRSVLEFRSAQYILDPEARAGQHRGPPLGAREAAGGRRPLCVDEVSMTAIASSASLQDTTAASPYESTVVSLSHSEYLVWFEGLQYGQSALQKMVGGTIARAVYVSGQDWRERENGCSCRTRSNLSGGQLARVQREVDARVGLLRADHREIPEGVSRRTGFKPLNIDNMVPWFL